MSYREIFESNNVDLQTILNKVNELPEASSGSDDPVLQEKTVSPSTNSQSVTADSGYDGLSKVTVNAMPTATQATPSITVSSGGLITAKSTQSAGYVSSGTKSATKQLTTQAAQTITPSASDKIIASGRYLTGAQTIKGDANLIAENIKNGISIFGISGSYSGDSGGYVVGTTTLDDEGNLTIPELINKSRFIVIRESVTMKSGIITGGQAGFVDTIYRMNDSSIIVKTYRSNLAELHQDIISYDNTTGTFVNDDPFVYATFEDTNYIYIAW